MLAVPLEEIPPTDVVVSLKFTIPRETPNTYMLEEFCTQGKVLRHEPLNDDAQAGVAVQFLRPIELGLEV